MSPVRSLVFFTLIMVAATARAELRSETVTYRDGDAELKGSLDWDDSYQGKRPGVLVVHEWWGLNDYVKRRAGMLAKLGYVAFAADMYGDARVTEHGSEAGEWSKQITANVDAWQRRALAGLDVLRRHQLVDTRRLGAVGYCFGGATVMQLAYAGADLRGVVSFHGSLPAPTEAQMKNIKASILAAHGSADSFVPPERVQAFQQALERAKADWHMVVFGGARHAFTNPNAGSYGIENLRYDEQADKRSWLHMQIFFNQLFGK